MTEPVLTKAEVEALRHVFRNEGDGRLRRVFDSHLSLYALHEANAARIEELDEECRITMETIATQYNDIEARARELHEARATLKQARAFVVRAVSANVKLPDFDPSEHNIVRAIDAALQGKA